MPKRSGGPAANVAADSKAEAVIGQQGDWTELFDPSGKPFFVPNEDVDHWLTQGYRLRAVDLEAALDELPQYWEAAHRALTDLVDGVLTDGHIDTNDSAAMATATVAMTQLTDAVGGLLRDVNAAYPVRQGEPVALVEQRKNPDGSTDQVEHLVDPGQADEYLTRPGWSRKQ